MAVLGDLFTWKGFAFELLVFMLTLLVSRRYFSSLIDIPGPFLASFSRLWHVVTIARGKQSIKVLELHRKHGMYGATRIDEDAAILFLLLYFSDIQCTGPFVRIAHDEVSVDHPDGIRKVLLAPNPKVSHPVRDWLLRDAILIFTIPTVTMV